VNQVIFLKQLAKQRQVRRVNMEGLKFLLALMAFLQIDVAISDDSKGKILHFFPAYKMCSLHYDYIMINQISYQIN